MGSVGIGNAHALTSIVSSPPSERRIQTGSIHHNQSIAIVNNNKCLRELCSPLIIELIVYIGLIFAILLDLFYIIFWCYHKHASTQRFNSILNPDLADAGIIDDETIVMQIFCFFSNFALYFGILQRWPLLCFSWIIIRVIWIYYAIIEWVRSLNVEGSWNEDDLMTNSTAPPIRKEIGENGLSRWRLVLYTYWPLILFFFIFLIFVGIFTFKVMDANNRVRKSFFSKPSLSFEEQQRLKLIQQGESNVN